MTVPAQSLRSIACTESRLHTVCKMLQCVWSMTQLNQSHANEDFRKPVRYLFKIGIAFVVLTIPFGIANLPTTLEIPNSKPTNPPANVDESATIAP